MDTTKTTKKNTTTTIISVRLPDELIVSIENVAEKRQWSRNKAINYLIAVGKNIEERCGGRA